MSLTDPVADFLARIRNAIRSRHQKVDIPASKLKLEIARILKEEGYVSNFKVTEEEGHRILRIYLKYSNGSEAAIATLRAPVRSAGFSGGKAASAALPPCSISLAARAMVSVGRA